MFVFKIQRGIFYFLAVYYFCNSKPKPQPVQDLKLWENIQNGDMKALNELHIRYFHQMCLFAKQSFRDDQLVENIVSDCFIKLWENRSKLEIKISLKSYLFRILRNLIIDHHRKRQELVDIVEEFPEVAEETEFDAQLRYVKLYKAIAKLPEQRRKILELAAFESLSYQEIADKLNISKNTVKSQIGRAYRFLKETLEPRDFYLFYFLQKK
ncbi:RNA polymerase sigma-70 factor [Puteibacter caeruleilacunae]|nr:RNA polymerase sigma-70 factor [Puteibacter caeruleilacunae]